MPHVISFILLFVFAFETAVPVSSLGGGLVDAFALQAADMASGETEESCETETKVKEKEADVMTGSVFGLERETASTSIRQSALIDFFIADYHRSAIDEPPEV
ncbi:MAG: hypothetical protein LW707_09680 [Sphingobacteriales bacterium]|jgi:hypothetical protein|nr:hypothetical protein [Sphingobacteriales bacterium]